MTKEQMQKEIAPQNRVGADRNKEPRPADSQRS